MTPKPCPFCGSTKLGSTRFEVGHLHWITCRDCKANGPVGIDEEESIGKWNIRVNLNKKDKKSNV